MKPVSIAYAKNNLSALLRRVRAGHPVIIIDRGVPVAQIVAPPSSRGIPPRLIELAERGAVRLGFVTLDARQRIAAEHEGFEATSFR